MESKNPMVRLTVYGKVKRMMNEFQNAKLTDTDRNLMRGIFVRKLKDFQEDYRDRMENKTLLMRLTGFIDTSSKVKNFKSYENTGSYINNGTHNVTSPQVTRSHFMDKVSVFTPHQTG